MSAMSTTDTLTVAEVALRTGLTKSGVRHVFPVDFGLVKLESVLAWESATAAKRARKEATDAAKAAREKAKLEKMSKREAALPEEWQKMFLVLGEKGQVLPTLGNAATILKYDADWNIQNEDGTRTRVLARNCFSGSIVLMGPPPPAAGFESRPGPYPRDLEDTDLTWARMWLGSKYSVELNEHTILCAFDGASDEAAYHPVVEYLNGLVWDYRPRLRTWMKLFLGVPYDLYSGSVARWFLMSACARIHEPGCQADHVLVLEGKQGIGKSTACRILAKEPEWYLSGARQLENKETAMQLRGKWVVEFPELSAMKRSEVEGIKEFFTTHTDKYVPKYKNVEVSSKRQCVFVATVNHSKYLSDGTGNRRFWPVVCAGPVDTSGLAENMDQIWAEANAEYWAYRTCPDERCASGDSRKRCRDHRWWPETDEQDGVFALEQHDRMVEDSWKPAVVKFMLECFTSGKHPTTPDVISGALMIPVGDMTEMIQSRMTRLLMSMQYRMSQVQLKESYERVCVWETETWQYREEDPKPEVK